MRLPTITEEQTRRLTKICLMIVIFLALTVALFYSLSLEMENGTRASRIVFALGGAVLLSGLGTGFLAVLLGKKRAHRGACFCPLAAAGLSLCLMICGYAFLGVWPMGEKSILMVDMHHQYAPLLSELRHMLLHGGNPVYSFHIGLGANFIPAFAYYLASPFNILLVLFPENNLPDAILLITLLKNALAAGAFAACVQYITRRRDAATVAVSVMYSLMLYMLAYSWNIMWLDVVILLPLCVLALEHMLRTGKMLPYVLLLALALFANYYMAFMLCVFLVLYFAVWQFRQPRIAKQRLFACLRFGAGSLLGGGLVAALLIPTALALGRTSAAGADMPDLKAEMPLFDWLGRLFCGASPTIRSGNQPNLYCGVAAVLLLPIYLTHRELPLRRRLCYGGLLAVLVLSCTLNQWDLVWHGLHSPNDLPYRFSFIACFVLLLMAGQVLAHIRAITVRQIFGSLAGLCGYLILWERFGGDSAPDVWMLYVNLGLLAAYAAVLALSALKRLPVRAGRLLLLVVVSAELLLGTGDTLRTLNSNEYFTNRADYMANDSTVAIDKAMRRAEELAAQDGETFCRMEYLPRSTCMDTALHHYPGITTFASSNPYQTTLLMGDLGYAINGVNSYLYHSYVPAVDALFGIRYVVLEVKLSNHRQLKLRDSVTCGEETLYIYENTAALPTAMAASADLRDFYAADYDPLGNHEKLYGALLGRSVMLYEMTELSANDDSANVYGSSFSTGDDGDTTFTATIDTQGQYYAYVDCGAAGSIDVDALNEDGSSQNDWSVTNYEPYIIDMGTLKPGQQVDVTISGNGRVSGNIYVARLDAAAMDEALNELSAGGWQVTEFADTRITGTVTVAADQETMFFSIPYDKGWTVTVDGETVETFMVSDNGKGDGALLGAAVTPGTHTVTLTYRAAGLLPGLLVSAVCLLLLVAGVLWARRTKPTQPAAQLPAIPDEKASPAAEEAAPTADNTDNTDDSKPTSDKPEEA